MTKARTLESQGNVFLKAFGIFKEIIFQPFKIFNAMQIMKFSPLSVIPVMCRQKRTAPAEHRLSSRYPFNSPL